MGWLCLLSWLHPRSVELEMMQQPQQPEQPLAGHCGELDGDAGVCDLDAIVGMVSNHEFDHLIMQLENHQNREGK